MTEKDLDAVLYWQHNVNTLGLFLYFKGYGDEKGVHIFSNSRDEFLMAVLPVWLFKVWIIRLICPSVFMYLYSGPFAWQGDA